MSSSWIRSPLDSQRVCDIRSPFDPQRVSVSGHSSTSFRCKSPLFGPTQYFWLSNGQENSLSRVSVAADYSDPLPDSSNFMGNNGYHPLEELREQRRVCDAKLTDAEIARTTVEVFSLKFLVFIDFIIDVSNSIHLTLYHVMRGKLFLSAIRMAGRSDFSFSLRLTTEVSCCSLLLHTVNRMNKSHGLIFNIAFEISDEENILLDYEPVDPVLQIHK